MVTVRQKARVSASRCRYGTACATQRFVRRDRVIWLGISPGFCPKRTDLSLFAPMLFHALKVRSPHVVLRTKGHNAPCSTTPQKVIIVAPCCTKPQKVRSSHVAPRLKGQIALCCTWPQRSNRPMYPAPKVRSPHVPRPEGQLAPCTKPQRSDRPMYPVPKVKSPYAVPRLKGKIAPCSIKPQRSNRPALYHAPKVRSPHAVRRPKCQLVRSSPHAPHTHTIYIEGEV